MWWGTQNQGRQYTRQQGIHQPIVSTQSKLLLCALSNSAHLTPYLFLNIVLMRVSQIWVVPDSYPRVCWSPSSPLSQDYSRSVKPPSCRGQRSVFCSCDLCDISSAAPAVSAPAPCPPKPDEQKNIHEKNCQVKKYFSKKIRSQKLVLQCPILRHMMG